MDCTKEGVFENNEEINHSSLCIDWSTFSSLDLFAAYYILQ
jgi:hypothetical protein